MFNIRPTDRGRPLTDLVSRVSLDLNPRRGHPDGILRRRLDPEADHRQRADATHYLLRLAPYRNSDHKIEGVVVTFVDITFFTRAEAQQKALIAELQPSDT